MVSALGLMDSLKEVRKKLKWLDPFTYVDLLIVNRLKQASRRVQIMVFLLCMSVVSVLFYLFVNGGTMPLPFFMLMAAALTAFIYFYLKDEAVEWGVYLASAFVFALVFFYIAGVLLGTNFPMMIVVSGSMEPVMHRGDVVFLQGVSAEGIRGQEVELDLPTLQNTPLANFAQLVYEVENGSYQAKSIKFLNGQEIEIDKQGDTVVYFSKWRGEQIIHRVVAKLKAGDGTYLLTKGDSVNNPTLDQDCGRVAGGMPEKRNCISLYPVGADDMQGKAIFLIPLVGYAKLLIFDDIPLLLFGCRNPYGCPFP